MYDLIRVRNYTFRESVDVDWPCSGIQVQFSYLKTLVSKWYICLHCSVASVCVSVIYSENYKIPLIEAIFELCFRLLWMIERIKFQTAKVGNGS